MLTCKSISIFIHFKADCCHRTCSEGNAAFKHFQMTLAMSIRSCFAACVHWGSLRWWEWRVAFTQLVGFSLSQLVGELRPSRVAPARLHLFLFPGFSPGLRRAFHSPKDGLFHKTCRKLFHISILVIRTTILGKKIILFMVSRIVTELEFSASRARQFKQ